MSTFFKTRARYIRMNHIYELADAPRKAKAIRARAESLPGVGVSARGVAEAAAPTRKTLTPRSILETLIDVKPLSR
jgi:hypothetical protein